MPATLTTYAAKLHRTAKRFLSWLILGHSYRYCLRCEQMSADPKYVWDQVNQGGCLEAWDCPSACSCEPVCSSQPAASPFKSTVTVLPTRTLSYWSAGGEFYRWRYTAATLQQVHVHVARLADDPTFNFTWDDAARVHGLIRFMDLTEDCQDVVGW